MGNKNDEMGEIPKQVYKYAFHFMVREERSAADTIRILADRWLDEAMATAVVGKVSRDIRRAKRRRAAKQMFHGVLWLIGGVLCAAFCPTIFAAVCALVCGIAFCVIHFYFGFGELKS